MKRFTLVESSVWVHEKTGDVRLIDVYSTPIMGWSNITLPWLSNHVVILVGSHRDWKTDARLRAHELVHVRQLSEMGMVKYLIAHIVARIKARSVYAVNEPIEKEAYEEAYRLVPGIPDVRISTWDTTLAPLSPTDVLVGDITSNGMLTRWYRRVDGSRYGMFNE